MPEACVGLSNGSGDLFSVSLSITSGSVSGAIKFSCTLADRRRDAN
ncbi:hypothetical protein SJ05684_a38240 (plasmid) [Sinorhizobium sojae CCBAU 05684]|uniref:Uncharacterized protein n=1 Tax=Sinorhizobium sojae CCBAU 05684 TaxID=716928 RepID=A0A249PMH4_9HYPH|nr:hypothetical protein SJ05684_a38240 [Sinorhizobium sojae CCBAU 05684]